jgi:hypothetical protein
MCRMSVAGALANSQPGHELTVAARSFLALLCQCRVANQRIQKEIAPTMERVRSLMKQLSELARKAAV